MSSEALTVRDYVEQAVDRRPLSDSASQGYSGARLERLLLRDGRSVILKTSSASHDLAMRVTRDAGRSALLFSQGVYARFPDGIDTTVLAAESSDEGVQLIMRDVSGLLVADEQRLSRAESLRILSAVSSLHDAFQGEPLPLLCSLETHLTCLSPAAVSPYADWPGLPRHILAGWERFDQLLPSRIRDAVYAVHSRPERLADEMRKHGVTLAHGDLWLANVGLSPDKVILIDFGLAVQAPGDLDLALYVLGNWWQIEATREEIIEDWRRLRRAAYDERSLRLALIAAFVEYGWLKAVDADQSAEQAADYAWWAESVGSALEEVWSPP